MRLLAQANNAVPSATVSASSVLPATRTVFRRPGQRAGNGQVILSGGYIGANDSEMDIEIRAPQGSSVRVSQPVFAGSGNGPITQPTAAEGTAAQEVTVTLIDLGKATTNAQAVIYGDIVLRAKAAGAAGNAIRLTVSPLLTLATQPLGALSFNLNKDTQEWTDQRGDFGAAPLDPDGAIPVTAPRLAFAGDLSRVYRHYKRWDGTQWQYGLSPKLATDHVQNAAVHTVTGTYTVTVADGVAIETYPNLVTLYDLLAALSASSLADVVGVIAKDAKPNGLAATDVPLRTTAFVLPAVASDPQRMPALRDVSVLASARTETMSVTCTANTPVGRETWTVQSRMGGALPSAHTGEPYAQGDVHFTIPVIARTDSPIAGQIAITARNFPRATSDTMGLPAICLDRPVLGAKAASQTLRLIWTARPAKDCNCAEATVQGGPSKTCLGINIDDKGVLMGDLVAAHQSRLVTLYQWREAFFTGNTALKPGVIPVVARYDLDFADQATTLLAQALRDVFKVTSAPAQLALDAWDAAMTGLDADFAVLEDFYTAATTTPDTTPEVAPSTAYAVGDVRLWPVGEWQADRANPNLRVFVKTGTQKMICTVAGTVGNQLASYDVTAPPNEIATLINGNINIFQDFTRWSLIAPPTGTSKDLSTTLGEAVSELIAQFVRRYAAKMDHVRSLAGLDPKTEASTQGGGCWQDPGDAFYWVIDGTAYLPVFNNVYYHSVVLDADGRPLSTEEFGFGLRVACEDRLKPGDTLTITIADVTANYPYKIGDRYDIASLGGGPIALTGGITGTDTLTWKVDSSAAGALPDYALTAAEPAYNAGNLNFTIHRGGLPFALCDQFRFAVETGGLWRARRDGQAWLADTAITESTALVDGLNVNFMTGASPSFVAGDLHQFVIRQPHSPSHVQSAHGEAWKWSGSTATLTLGWPNDQTISVVGLLRHGLRSPATVTIILRDASHAVLATLAPTVKPGPLVMPLLATLSTVRSLTITVSNATDMALGWVYAGEPFATEHTPRVSLKRAYALERPEGYNPRSAYLGTGWGGEITWSDWLLQAEFDTVLALVDHCKRDGDAPIVLVPQINRPDEAALVRIDSDALEVSDYFDYQPKDVTRRRLSLKLPLAAVLS